MSLHGSVKALSNQASRHVVGLLMTMLLIACLLAQGCTSAIVPDESQPSGGEPAPTETVEQAPPEPPPNPILTYAESIELPEELISLLTPSGEDGDMPQSDKQIVDVTKTIADLDSSDDAMPYPIVRCSP